MTSIRAGADFCLKKISPSAGRRARTKACSYPALLMAWQRIFATFWGRWEKLRRRKKTGVKCRWGEADISISQRRHTHSGAMLDMARREFSTYKKGLSFKDNPFHIWWAVQDLNLWPPPCKGGAQPTELTARNSVAQAAICPVIQHIASAILPLH